MKRVVRYNHFWSSKYICILLHGNIVDPIHPRTFIFLKIVFEGFFAKLVPNLLFFYLPYLFILRVISLHLSVQNPFALSHTFHFFVHQLVKSHYCCNNLLDLDQACFWEKKRSTLNYEKYLQQQTQTMNNQTSHFDWNCTR